MLPNLPDVERSNRLLPNLPDLEMRNSLLPNLPDLDGSFDPKSKWSNTSWSQSSKDRTRVDYYMSSALVKSGFGGTQSGRTAAILGGSRSPPASISRMHAPIPPPPPPTGHWAPGRIPPMDSVRQSPTVGRTVASSSRPPAPSLLDDTHRLDSKRRDTDPAPRLLRSSPSDMPDLPALEGNGRDDFNRTRSNSSFELADSETLRATITSTFRSFFGGGKKKNKASSRVGSTAPSGAMRDRIRINGFAGSAETTDETRTNMTGGAWAFGRTASGATGYGRSPETDRRGYSPERAFQVGASPGRMSPTRPESPDGWESARGNFRGQVQERISSNFFSGAGSSESRRSDRDRHPALPLVSQSAVSISLRHPPISKVSSAQSRESHQSEVSVKRGAAHTRNPALPSLPAPQSLSPGDPTGVTSRSAPYMPRFENADGPKTPRSFVPQYPGGGAASGVDSRPGDPTKVLTQPARGSAFRAEGLPDLPGLEQAPGRQPNASSKYRF